MHRRKATSRRVCRVLLGIVLATSLGACLKHRATSPGALPASGSVHYAVEYPNRLQGLADRFANERLAVEYAIENLAAFPESLQEPDWGKVHFVVDQAVADGRSEAFVQRMAELDAIARFIDANSASLDSPDGGLTRALQEHRAAALDKQSDALQTLDYFHEGRGAYNVSILREQVLSIAFAAYVVYVELPELHAQLSDTLDEATEVKSRGTRTCEERTLAMRSASLSATAAAPCCRILG